MTNKEAIRVLKSTSINFSRMGGKTAYVEALEMAITALEISDSISQQLDCKEFHIKLNNSNEQLNDSTATQFNAIKTHVKGLTACRVPEDDTISRADVEQTVEDNILCYTHSDRPIDQDPDTECHMAIRTALRMLRKDLRKLPSVQSETCDTCKHGYFGDEQCNSCSVRFTSHYERRTDEQT